MDKILKHILLAFVLMLPLTAAGVKAVPYPVTVLQPDGTTLQIVIHGDESASYKTTIAGIPVVQDSDGWYRQVASSELRSTEPKRMIANGMAAYLGAATKGVTLGKMLVIPVQFQDVKFTKESIRLSLNALFNQTGYSEDGATGSVKDYFKDNLGDVSQMKYDVTEIVTVSQNESYYGANTGGRPDANVKKLVTEACTLVHAAGVNFAEYDMDGDGKVENVFLIFAGHNEAEGGGDDTLWPQSWNIASEKFVLDGVQITNFSLYSEYSGATGKTFAGIGTICHELCHFLGLVDMYDTNGEEEGLSYGLCKTLSIMDYGNYCNEGRTPPYLNVVEKEMLGLLQQENISREGAVSVNSIQTAEKAFYIQTSSSGERYLLEYRTGEKWDEYIGGRGLVIYHVDKSSNKVGSMTAAMRWQENAVNCYAEHPCATPFPSVSDFDGEVEGTFFPGPDNLTSIASDRNFAILSWSGVGTGYGLENITVGDECVTFNVIKDDAWNLPYATDCYVEAGQYWAELSWNTDKNTGGEWIVELTAASSPEVSTISAGESTSCKVDNLTPGEEYDFSIYSRSGSVAGKRFSSSFTTVRRMNDFPLISGFDKELEVGSEVNLSVINIAETVRSTVWYLDGAKQSSSTIVFETSGQHVVKAEITYSDGAVEILQKTLTVK